MPSKLSKFLRTMPALCADWSARCFPRSTHPFPLSHPASAHRHAPQCKFRAPRAHNRLPRARANVPNTLNQVRLLQELDHPNIVKLHKVLESPDTCHLFMEHCTGGELLGLMDHMEFDDDGVRSLQFDDLHSGEAVEFSEQQIVYILHQVLEAVKHCHDRCIVHRDLKAQILESQCSVIFVCRKCSSSHYMLTFEKVRRNLKARDPGTHSRQSVPWYMYIISPHHHIILHHIILHHITFSLVSALVLVQHIPHHHIITSSYITSSCIISRHITAHLATQQRVRNLSHITASSHHPTSHHPTSYHITSQRTWQHSSEYAITPTAHTSHSNRYPSEPSEFPSRISGEQ